MFIAASSSEHRTNPKMSQKSDAAQRPADKGFTEKQGQYLAFIYTYSHMFRCPPAEADIQRHFQVSPPSVHQMIVTLERNGLIRRQPRVPRSIEILVPPQRLPILEWLEINQSTSLCKGTRWFEHTLRGRPSGAAQRDHHVGSRRARLPHRNL
ncbi:helix-turn-helix domain-containing protein [Mesorhizobium sp.]|uniref:LexA family protein n=2 Tax=Mesorhizobium sp. TaxID=1871066 RepID=UPI00344D1083